jgi:hypothetical protein
VPANTFTPGDAVVLQDLSGIAEVHDAAVALQNAPDQGKAAVIPGRIILDNRETGFSVNWTGRLRVGQGGVSDWQDRQRGSA